MVRRHLGKLSVLSCLGIVAVALFAFGVESAFLDATEDVNLSCELAEDDLMSVQRERAVLQLY